EGKLPTRPDAKRKIRPRKFIERFWKLTNSSARIPIEPRGIGPQLLEPVIGSSIRIEQVDYQIAVVLYDPLAGIVAFDTQATFAFTGEHVVDFFGDGMNLPAALARCNYEEIIKRCDWPHVEYEHFAGLVFRSQPGDPASQLSARLASSLIQ